MAWDNQIISIREKIGRIVIKVESLGIYLHLMLSDVSKFAFSENNDGIMIFDHSKLFNKNLFPAHTSSFL